MLIHVRSRWSLRAASGGLERQTEIPDWEDAKKEIETKKVGDFLSLWRLMCVPLNMESET